MTERAKSSITGAFVGAMLGGIGHLVLAKRKRGERLEAERMAAAVAASVAGALYGYFGYEAYR